ncbi:hypothetical protein PIB30_077518, partial [Stylosanthes scabra]|nr:hypothetical protein [Stylosanthes scabra]
IRLNHCKFFLWLDQHAANIERVANRKIIKEEEDDVDEHFWRLDIEKRVSDLEDKIASIERKGSCRAMVVFVFALSLVIVVCFGSHK